MNVLLLEYAPRARHAVRYFWLIVSVMTAFGPALASAAQAPLRPDIDEFIADMEARHQFDAGALRALFAKVQPRPNILRIMSTPSTAKPWYEFRPSYVNARRIEGGLRFWAENA